MTYESKPSEDIVLSCGCVGVCNCAALVNIEWYGVKGHNRCACVRARACEEFIIIPAALTSARSTSGVSSGMGSSRKKSRSSAATTHASVFMAK